MEAASVSVIIPYSRAELIETVLEKLNQQTYPHELIEIIVVGQPSRALEQQWSTHIVNAVTDMYPGQKRNQGARMARGDYLLFLDDDCEPEPDWIEQNVRELQNPQIGAVGGQIAGKSDAFFARCLDFSSFAFCQNSQRSEMQLCSASLGVRSQVYAAVQGFNETLRVCEDIDFCYRLIKLGYRTVYQPAIKVKHNHRRNSFKILMRYSYFFGRESGLYIKLLHPGMNRRNQVLTLVRHPLAYALLLVPIALSITILIIRTNISEYPRVLLYAPFIFLAKLAFHIGVLQWLLQGPRQPLQPVNPPNQTAYGTYEGK
ncbi:glycosyltransferase [Dictyobacter kobayashii]|uniref:Glycosyl transferase n=1 Tax=Dictyobacter kobayashii TaxID=2014872 RepID=A0A402AWA0_9CHLR|nr:glycosyltransferase [Dictyobacter kobayashii]GCE23421.1 glycosyl transferase [Dictyobacter kobayashii]